MTEMKEKGKDSLLHHQKIKFPLTFQLRPDSIFITLYGSEVWGLLQDLPKWEKQLLEALHTELRKDILEIHKHTANNACRAERGQYPLIIKIQKRVIKFYKHLQFNDPNSYQYKAFSANS